MPDEGGQEGRLQTIRYIAVLVPGFVAGSRAVYAIRCLQEWHIWAAPRSSAGVVAHLACRRSCG
jgi:hypothetical protein